MPIQLRPAGPDIFAQFIAWASVPELADFFRHRGPAFTWATTEGCTYHLDNAFVIYEGSKAVGLVQLSQVDLISRSCGIGMLIDSTLSRSRFETSRSVYEQILDYCFNTMQMHRVHMKVISNRDKLISRLCDDGWRVEGLLQQSCFMNGEPKDEILLGLLKSERRK